MNYQHAKSCMIQLIHLLQWIGMDLRCSSPNLIHLLHIPLGDGVMDQWSTGEKQHANFYA